MGKFYSKIIFLMLPVFAMGQLHIKSATAGTAANKTYVYNKGEILFVTQGIGMDGNPDQDGGNLYLREEGQLIQGNNASANTGDGIVSVYQENTRNAWDYHMWTSPVGDPLESAGGNGNTGNARFYMSSNLGGGIYQVVDELDSDPASFTAGYDGKISPLTLSTTWLYKYIATQGYSGWKKVDAANPLLPGEGFSMKGVGGGTTPTSTAFDFRGRPNNGTIEVDIKKGQRTLVGNPYPSAMNLSYYLLYNSAGSVTGCEGIGTPSTGPEVITGEAFFWESDENVKSHYLFDYQGGYGTFVPDGTCGSTGTYTGATYLRYNEDGTVSTAAAFLGGSGSSSIGRRYAPIGQGFFVLGSDNLNDGQVYKIVAKNDFRVFEKEDSNPNSDFRKPGKGTKKTETKTTINLSPGQITYDDNGFLVLPKFTLETFINKTYTRTLKGVMFDESTMGYDYSADGQNRTLLKTDVNFKLEEDDRPFLINNFPYSIDAALALKIDGEKETNFYAMRVTDLNFTPDEGIWLYDKETDEYFDILNETYEFELPKGNYADRFEVRFKDGNKENLDIAEEVKESFAVYQNNSLAELTILNPLETELKDISVYDITGKLLVSKINEGTNSKVTIPSNTWSDGIYVVRVVTRDNVEYSKKVSVFNKN
ncbi:MULTISPECIES: T9SS type A sorting domain-containing protein [unclassified Leeuwenhoekiella]|uniref:T9SS type A sorting domain-containing protein n=1 Tax=unclassified Leeuwenhoekiella TaxID=2615029 RepID=UPI000C60C3D4|nr:MULTISPECIES: T9SS type A sorting domain-containing protein [unclassified Leeuwenhoekiella]MAW94593.1 hypothetical protein [Leeuwenhoekiella sp.]MBA82016.1 hypothetical protein [Leeuwenhoekiella sp.]|tara:strand:- start:3674 stop:5623 length:1950 start_codon:yes stop_codon:yes gene_type:complete